MVKASVKLQVVDARLSGRLQYDYVSVIVLQSSHGCSAPPGFGAKTVTGGAG